VATILLIGVNGWFALGLIAAVPLSILYWFDYGRELREAPATSGARRWLGLLMGLPQAFFGVVCLGTALVLVGFGLYNFSWQALREHAGDLLSLPWIALLGLFGAGLVVDAFSRGRKAAEVSPAPSVTVYEDVPGTAFDRYYVWEIISYAWTEIGIEDRECQALVQKGNITHDDLREVDRIIFRDVCASFAIESFLILPCMLWMIMPDWGYEETYLRRRVERWYAAPRWRLALNPMRWLGYPTAVLFALKYRAMLRRAVRAAAS